MRSLKKSEKYFVFDLTGGEESPFVKKKLVPASFKACLVKLMNIMKIMNLMKIMRINYYAPFSLIYLSSKTSITLEFGCVVITM